MTVYQDRFEEGDKVTWRDDYWATFDDGRRRFGAGPFTVTRVQEVPKDIEGVAHTQWIHVTTVGGMRSGAFFKKVEEKHG